LRWLPGRQPRPGDGAQSWDSVPVRLEGPISTSVQTNTSGVGRRRKIIPQRDNTFMDYRGTTGGGSYQEEPRKRSFQDRLNDLWSNPAWRRNSGMKNLIEQGEKKADEEREKLKENVHHIQPWSVPHADSGDDDDDSHSTLSHYKHKVRRKLGLDSPNDSDVDAPFTALGADPHSDSDSDSDLTHKIRQRRRVRIKSGATAIGLVHSGAAAAVPGAGDAGQELFVQEVGANDDVLMPTAPQDVSMALGGAMGNPP